MVPGMTERDCLAADLRRLEWLYGASLGPPLPSARPAVQYGPPNFVPLGLYRRGFMTELGLGRRVCLARLRSVCPLHKGATGRVMS
jgi:hypothetical protein